jgi:hypothetical protein
MSAVAFAVDYISISSLLVSLTVLLLEQISSFRKEGSDSNKRLSFNECYMSGSYMLFFPLFALALNDYTLDSIQTIRTRCSFCKRL